MISKTPVLRPVADLPRPRVELEDHSRPDSVPQPAMAGQISGKQILLKRMEFKYLVNRTTRTALTRDLLALMRRDAFGEEDGTYLVRSLYFDTPYHRAFQEKADGAAIRHKLRVRAYGADPSETAIVRLEVKSRILGLIRKTVIDVPREKYPELEETFSRRTLPPEWLLNARGVSPEFFRIQRQYNQEPKVLIQYRREAFERQELGRIRVNFDDELVATSHLRLLEPLDAPRRVLRYGHSVFEIKVDGTLPTWMHMLIGKYNLQNQAFSKYCYGLRTTARLSTEMRVDDSDLDA